MDMEDVVYFELNNWFSGRDYPNEEPFITWCGDDCNLYFSNEAWVKANKLCVVESLVDMSVNWCITAQREWVEKNCPKLLSDESIYVEVLRPTPSRESSIQTIAYPYKSFIRIPDEDGDVYGRFGTLFKEWSEDNIGIEYEEL